MAIVGTKQLGFLPLVPNVMDQTTQNPIMYLVLYEFNLLVENEVGLKVFFGEIWKF